MGISAIPREAEDNNYAKCFFLAGGGGGVGGARGQKRCIMGGAQMANGSFSLILLQRQSVMQKGLQHQKESSKPGIFLKTKKRNAKC